MHGFLAVVSGAPVTLLFPAGAPFPPMPGAQTVWRELSQLGPYQWVQVVLSVGLLLVLFAAGIWDVFVLIQHLPDRTVSAAIQTWSADYPHLTFLFGVLMGHLFWQNAVHDGAVPKL